MAKANRQQKSEPPADMDGLEPRSNPIPRYFAFTFLGLVAWGALFIGYFLLSDWSSAGEFEEKMKAHQARIETGEAQKAANAPAATAIDPAAVKAEGEKLYAAHCVACHGEGGAGGIGPSLATPDYRFGKELAVVKTSISSGRPGGMPGFGSQLSAEEVEILARHLISL